jgi:hypothetical protein
VGREFFTSGGPDHVRSNSSFSGSLDAQVSVLEERAQTALKLGSRACEATNPFVVTAFPFKQLVGDVDIWVRSYNEERPHSGKHCFGKTPWQTFLDSKALALEKQLDRTMPTTTVAA